MPTKPASRTPRAGRRAAPAQRKIDATGVAPILGAVKTLLRNRHSVSLPDLALDLLFDQGVFARCRECGLSWEVKRTNFSMPGWWSCPSGCRPSRRPAVGEGSLAAPPAPSTYSSEARLDD